MSTSRAIQMVMGSSPRKQRQEASERGHTLLELLIAITMVSIVAALMIPKLSGRDDAARLAKDAMLRIRERRAAAIQLNALTTATVLQNYVQPPVTIDFTNLDSTRGLRIDGTDANNDGIDDNTGLPLTRFQPPTTAGSTGTWSYAYQGEALTLPAGWRIATAASDLSPIPAIPLGVPTTLISFSSTGKVSNPPPTNGSIDPNKESPFPTVYFTNGTDAYAVAVHVTGPELWQWDKSANLWRGFGLRTVTAGS